MSFRNIITFALFFLTFGLSPALRAQVTTATLSGVVTDSSGAIVPGAALTLRNTNTGQARTLTTNDSGSYSFDFVPIGPYTLQVASNGFRTQQRNSISLSAADQQRVDFSLAPAGDSTTVEVSASSSESIQLDSESTQQTLSLDSTSIGQLPVAKQDWTSVLQLGAGVSTDNSSSAPAGASLSINGLPPAGFNLTVDGTNATSDPESPAFGFYQGPNIINTINNDAIAEVSIVKGIAPATIGGTMSGNVNIITKSGTNKFHGSLYEINELSAYDARNQFLTTKPRLTFNEYGGSVGGPIYRNKLFFFGSYEGARASSYAAVTGTVPTPYFRTQAPASYAPILNEFPTVAQPTSDPTALTAQYFGAGSQRQTDGNGMARIDYNPNENNMLYVRYIRARPYKFAPSVIAINARATTGHTDAFNAGYTHSGKGWTSLSRFGTNRIRLQRLDEGFSSDLEELKVVGVDTAGAEQFLKTGEFYTGEQQFAKTIRNHSLTAGAIVQRQNAGRTDYNTAVLAYGSFADFQNNLPNNITISFDLDPFTLHTYQFGGFLQDDWKATSNFTLNLGLRYDYFTIPKEASNRIFNRGVNPATPDLGGGFGDYRPADSMYNGDFNNVQPRVGFAWSLGKNQSTVVRGGAGVFVSPHPIYGGPIDEVQNSASEPFRVTLTGAQAANSGLTYPLPRSTFDTVLANLQNEGVISKEVVNTSINGDFPDPYSVQWMFGVEQQLPLQHRIEIDYVGNRGLKENMTITKNLPDRVTGALARPDFSQFRYYYAGDASNYHGLQVQMVKAPWHGLSYGASYAWSRSMAFADANLLLQANPQDNDKIRADYGRTPFDIRNRFTGNFVYEPKITSWTGWTSRPAKLLLDGWQVSGLFKANSGLPVNLINSSSSYSSDRPDAVIGVARYLPVSATSRQYLNTKAFAAVPISAASSAQIRGGNLHRDDINLPSTFTLDLTAGKTFELTDTVHFQLKADAFNILNRTNYSTLVTDTSSTQFGQLTAATARTMQITGRLTF
ncbi:MAG TPA: TonB-dependent receptor [Granulicella sp.]